MLLSEIADFNKKRTLARGCEYSSVMMSDIEPNNKYIQKIGTNSYAGGGAKFVNGDILFARITPCMENGKVVLVSGLNKDEIGFGSTEFIVITAKNKDENDFIYYLIKDQLFMSYAKGRMEGSSGRQRVSWQSLADYEFKEFSTQERVKIGEFLASFDHKIELNRKQNETLESMCSALFKSWFVDFEPVKAKRDGRWKKGMSLPGMPEKLFDAFSDALVETELGGIPKGWKISKIGEVADVVGGATPSTKEPKYWEGGSCCWATPKDLSGKTIPVLIDTKRKITDQGVEKISSRLLPIGTVLLSCRAPVGYLAINYVETSINQGFLALNCNALVSNYYILYWGNYNIETILNHSNGSIFKELTKINLIKLPIIVPPVSILEMFNYFCDPIFEKIVSNEKENKLLERLRDSLLPKLMSGELRAPDADKFLGPCKG